MPPSKKVTGSIAPDATGNYDYDGEYDGFESYRRPDGLWFIWHHPFAQWVISDAKGNLVGAKWERHFPEIDGDYQPFGSTGIATVSEILP